MNLLPQLCLSLHVLKNIFKSSDVTLSCFVSMTQVQSIKYGLLDRVAEDNVVNVTPTLPLADMLDSDPLTESEATLVDESSTDKIENSESMLLNQSKFSI